MPEEPIHIARHIEEDFKKVDQQISILQEDVSELSKLAGKLDLSIQSYIESLKPWMEIKNEVSDLHKLIAKRLRGLIIKFSWKYIQKKIFKAIQSAFDESEDFTKNNLSFHITILSINESKDVFCIKEETDVIALHIEGNLSDNGGIIPTQLIKVDLLIRMALKSPLDNTLVLTPVISRPMKISSSLTNDSRGITFIRDTLKEMVDKKIKAATIPAKIKLPFLPTKATENRWQTEHKSYCLITHLEASDDCILSGHFFSYANGVSRNGTPVDLPEGVLTDVVVQVTVFSAMPTSPKLNVPEVNPTHPRPDWADAEFHISTARYTEIITTEIKRQVYAASSERYNQFIQSDIHAGYFGITNYDENGNTIKKFLWIAGFPLGWYLQCTRGEWKWNNWSLEYDCYEWGNPHYVQAPLGATGEFKIIQNGNNAIVNFEIKMLGTDKYNQVIPIPLSENAERIEYVFDDDFISFFVRYKEI